MKNLVSGFLSYEKPDESSGVLYAVPSEGDILECVAPVACVHFDMPGRIWKRSEKSYEWIKAHAEFIGSYSPPREVR